MNKSNGSSMFMSQGQQILLGNKKNCLLQKDDIGKAKPTTRRLPDNNFTFGKPNSGDMESAGAVTMNWVSHTKSDKFKAPEVRDFKKINKIVLS